MTLAKDFPAQTSMPERQPWASDKIPAKKLVTATGVTTVAQQIRINNDYRLANSMTNAALVVTTTCSSTSHPSNATFVAPTNPFTGATYAATPVVGVTAIAGATTNGTNTLAVTWGLGCVVP